MRTFSLVIVHLMLCLSAAFGQKPLSLSGNISDAESGELLIGVSVLVEELNKGVVSNHKGDYELKLEKGHYQIRFSYIGYISQTIEVKLEADQFLSLSLKPAAIQTKEVLISSRRPEENLTNTIDVLRISGREIGSLPALLGQADPLKTLQLLPGVQSNGEGNNGLFVRGGAIDQNLILLDQAPVYNTGHLFGFFSLFNHSFLQEVNLIKGGIPASYGGRLSSIIEVKSRSGNFQQFKAEGNIGVVAGNFSVEGPLAKGKSAFLLSGRRTYLDLLSKMLTSDPTIFNTGIDYFFDDLNARIDVKASAKDRIVLSAYSGTDDFLFDGKNSLSNKIRWKNRTASLSWEHFYKGQNYHKISLFSSHYQMDFLASINTYSFSIASSIQDHGLKAEWVIGSVEKHRISFGAEYMHHTLLPNNIKARGADIEFDFSKQEKLPNQEQALFIQDEIQLSEQLILSAGLRLSAYQQLGPFTRYVSDESMSLLDTLHYSKNERAAAYMRLAPRAALSYQLSPGASLKASFDRTHQYLHMAPVSSVSLPTDVWVPSSEKIKPQQGTQYALGYYQNFRQNSLESSATVYYKEMSKQMEYRDGVVVGYSKGHTYDDNFIFGKGKSYGLELFLRKHKGRLTGWLSYTLSKTTRSFEEINQGKSFAAKYDRLHNFSWVSNYQLNKRWSLSGVFTYSTGNALTLPIGRYIINGNIINEYQGRNTFRMPAYHRMDLSASYMVAKRKNFESSWIFSIYNVYNRKNPYYIYFDTRGNVNDYYLEVSLEKVSLFPIIPAIAWQFKI